MGQDRIPEDFDKVVPERPDLGRAHARYGDLVDQMAEEGGLREDLDVQKFRGRLKRYRQDLP